MLPTLGIATAPWTGRTPAVSASWTSLVTDYEMAGATTAQELDLWGQVPEALATGISRLYGA